MEKLITMNELTEHLQVTRTTVDRWRKEGLPHKKYGKIVRFNLDEVLRWLEER